MNAETLEALNKSIEHWERLANGTAAEDEDVYCSSCALCSEFNSHIDCLGCPVASAGYPNCGRNSEGDSSAWLVAEKYFDEIGKDSSEFKTAALRQLEFLKSLVPQ